METINDYYSFDCRCGSIVTINGKSAYDLFNADLKEKKAIAGEITADFRRILNSSGLSISKYDINTGGLEMAFYVGGNSKQECDMRTSHLIAECRQCVIKTDEDDFEYLSVLTEFDIEYTGVDYYNEVVLTFSTIKRMPLSVHTFTGGGTYNNAGSIESGARLTVTTTQDTAELVIDGITIKNLSANIPFIIDGILGEVKSNGINRFSDTDLIDFPKALPGNNTIEASDDTCTIEVAFYPTFIV